MAVAELLRKLESFLHKWWALTSQAHDISYEVQKRGWYAKQRRPQPLGGWDMDEQVWYTADRFDIWYINLQDGRAAETDSSLCNGEP